MSYFYEPEIPQFEPLAENGENYATWRQTMLTTLDILDLGHFVATGMEGTAREDVITRREVRSHLTPALITYAIEFLTTRDLWTALATRFTLGALEAQPHNQPRHRTAEHTKEGGDGQGVQDGQGDGHGKASAKWVFPPRPLEHTYSAPKAQVPNEASRAQLVYSLALGSTSLGLGAPWSTSLGLGALWSTISIISQDVAGAPGGTDTSSVAGSQFDHNGSIVFSQSDRLRRRNSLTSMAGTSDIGSLSTYDYKSQDSVIDADDSESQYSHSVQSGVTEF
ncbi:hypothetical protein BDV93DRAFT_582021 [Ceratobasidium sp. AG-I]|nr:hypothetical protein BDV93DRAFT_582021 [Ceratobasidium sp. AG-I]